MSDDKVLDPEIQHSVIDLLDGGVRLKAEEVDAVDALAWAAANKVVLDDSGKIEALINSARAARNLTLWRIKAPPKSILGTEPQLFPLPPAKPAPVPAPLQAQPGEVTMTVVFQYAKAERITWNRVQPLIDQVNDYRKGWGLPAFRIMAKDALPADYKPEPTFVDLESPAEPKSRTWSGIMPVSEAEVLDLAYNFNGLISGLVTPEVASWLLTLNTGNRKLNRSGDGVKRFVRLLRTGQWMLTGEPVIVSSEGVINDGQHRLHAIVESGIPGHLDIRFGIDRSAFVATNTGVRRSIGQVLTIAGRPNGPMQGSIARFLYFYDRGEVHRADSTLEGMEIVDLVEKEPSIGEVAKLVNSLHKFKPIRNSPFASILTIAARGVPMDRVREFAKLCESGQGDEDLATRRLHERLAKIRMDKLYIPKIDVAIMTVMAWNSWYENKPMRRGIRIEDAHRTGPGFPRIVGSE